MQDEGTIVYIIAIIYFASMNLLGAYFKAKGTERLPDWFEKALEYKDTIREMFWGPPVHAPYPADQLREAQHRAEAEDNKNTDAIAWLKSAVSELSAELKTVHALCLNVYENCADCRVTVLQELTTLERRVPGTSEEPVVPNQPDENDQDW